MSRIIMVTGGARSGKSHYAEQCAMNIPGDRAYVATCPPDIDPEMNARIEKHREHRKRDGWVTFEEEVNVFNLVRQLSQFQVVLVDCLTLWINNLLYRNPLNMSEDFVYSQCLQLKDLKLCLPHTTLILVTNETGMGIVPSDRETRLFRDLIGRCNQSVASFSDEVLFMVSGIPMKVKG